MVHLPLLDTMHADFLLQASVKLGCVRFTVPLDARRVIEAWSIVSTRRGVRARQRVYTPLFFYSLTAAAAAAAALFMSSEPDYIESAGM